MAGGLGEAKDSGQVCPRASLNPCTLFLFCVMLIHAIILFCQLTLSCRPAHCFSHLPLSLSASFDLPSSLPFHHFHIVGTRIYHTIFFNCFLHPFLLAFFLIQPLMPYLQHPLPYPLLLPSLSLPPSLSGVSLSPLVPQVLCLCLRDE